LNIEELNKQISNPSLEFKSLEGFEVICESLVYDIYDLYGRNTLLSMLYQIGKGPGETIANRIKEKYKKQEFEILEAVEILLKELKDYYSIKIRDIEEHDHMLRFIIENSCFLREPIKDREKLKFGKAFCRINKGFFEEAFKQLIGDKIKTIEINFLNNDEVTDTCVEEVNFYYNGDTLHE
jgi:predicted hydrocarbon binding protein